MSWRRAPAWTHGALCAALAAALSLGAEWNRRLVVAPRHGQIVFGQARGEEAGVALETEGSPRIWQKIDKAPGLRTAAYGFVDFKQNRITLSYKIPEAEFQSYNDAYGYDPAEVTALQKWRDDATRGSYRLALATHKNQAQVNAAAAAIQKEYQQKLRAYLEGRGFLLEPGNVTRIDMPAVVRRNGPLAKPIAQVFDRFATRHFYQSIDIIGAVLSFAQTAVKYKEPEDVYKGRHTGGILPPITTVVLGWGDCDTKTGMMASILSNWDQMRMVGVSVPGHYLMGVLQIPDKGDMYVEFKGLQYILLEPAGPAWMPPGQVAEETVAQLNASDGYKLYPFF